jgi:acetyl-CoA C-acetyltransferase
MAGLIATDGAQIGIACGVEMMSGVPMGSASVDAFGQPKDPATWPWKAEASTQFEAVERIAAHRGITRADLDAFGVASQERAAAAWDGRRFDHEVIQVRAPALGADRLPNGETSTVWRDEGLRATTMETLSQLRPNLEGGLHTAGTSSQIADGAAALLWMDKLVAEERGLRPRARITYHTMVGCDPYYLLDGPVHATQKMLDQTKFTIEDFDVFECNEAFAAVVLSWQRAHNVPLDRINVNGGAIALGHPLGCTGSRLITTALHALEDRDGELAVITMCQGGALGVVTVLERLG